MPCATWAAITGLHRLAGLEIPFPVLDWNGIALKNLIHNRHHVGVETWSAFTAITGLALYGREIDVAWLDLHPRTPVRRHRERHELDGRRVYLLNGPARTH